MLSCAGPSSRRRLSIWWPSVARHRGRSKRGSVSVGTKTGPPTPRSLEKLGRFGFCWRCFDGFVRQRGHKLLCVSRLPSSTTTVLVWAAVPCSTSSCFNMGILTHVLHLTVFKNKMLIIISNACKKSAFDFSWRFCFYLIAFVAGLACVIDVRINFSISYVSNVCKAFFLYMIVCLRMSSGYSWSPPTQEGKNDIL